MTPVRIGQAVVGAGSLCWMAGPRYVESIRQIEAAAESLSKLGTKFIRARAYWPAAKPRDFRRHLVAGLDVLRKSALKYDLCTVSEIVLPGDVDIMSEYCDIVEVHPELVFNRPFLQALSKKAKAAILARHPLLTVEQFAGIIRRMEDWGPCRLILAESGASSAAQFDLSTIVALRLRTGHPVLVDCSRAAADAAYIRDLAAAAVAAGADGVLAEFESEETRGQAEFLVPLQLSDLMRRTQALKHTLNALAHLRYEER